MGKEDSLAALLAAGCACKKYLHFCSHVEFCLLSHGKEGNCDLILAHDPDPHVQVQGEEDGAQWGTRSR